MKLFLTVYIIGGIIWFFWSKNQGYVAKTQDTILWPITLFRQLRDANSVAV